MESNNFILTRKIRFRVHDTDGKRRNYIDYYMNGDQIMKQKYPYDQTYDYGFEARLLIKDDFLYMGRIHQTRYHMDTKEYRFVSFPVSKRVLMKHNVPPDLKIYLYVEPTQTILTEG